MLKKRIIPTLLFDDNLQCVKPVSFSRPYRKLGPINQYIQVMERRNVDEIILLDITATVEGREPNIERINALTTNLYCPVTYGGGISTLEHIRDILCNGADKVIIHTAALSDPNFIQQAANRFGSQAIVVSINSRHLYSINWVAHNRDIRAGAGGSFSSWSYALEMEKLGAGEIFITDVDKDGKCEGYNIELIGEVSKTVKIPVIANGGCQWINDMHDAIKAGASAVAAGSMFLYTETTPKMCADVLHGQFRVPVRIHDTSR